MLVWFGSLLVILAVVIGIWGTVTFARSLPLSLITTSGEPGDAALGGGGVPGEIEIEAKSGEYLWIWGVHRTGDELAVTEADITITGPDGATVSIIPLGSSDVTRGDYRAEHIATVHAPTAGTYRITVGDLTATYPPGDAGRFVVSSGEVVGQAVTGSALSVIGWVIAGMTLLVGVGLLIGGIVWGGQRRSAQRYRPPPPGYPRV